MPPTLTLPCWYDGPGYVRLTSNDAVPYFGFRLRRFIHLVFWNLFWALLVAAPIFGGLFLAFTTFVTCLSQVNQGYKELEEAGWDEEKGNGEPFVFKWQEELAKKSKEKAAAEAAPAADEKKRGWFGSKK